MNRHLRALLVPVLFLSAAAASAEKPAEKPSYVVAIVSAPLSLDQKTSIPGKVLDPGAYSIRIVDRLRDRFILRVEDPSGKTLSTFIGLHNPDFDPFDTLKHQGPIFWTAAPRGQKAIRGFSFPNGNTVELVYPKAEAVTLAKLNTNSVPAIDPESEGRKPDPKLTPEDREVVTLWMLTATRVGPKNETPAIEAKRFVAPPDAAEPAPVQSAAAALRPEPAHSQPRPVQIARADSSEAPRIRSSVKKLPRTASNLPLTLLLALFSLSAAAALRLTRTRI
jgi:hypothetical protein